MKIRQVYVCGKDTVCIRFIYNNIGSIVGSREINNDLQFGENEFAVPNVEVTSEFFANVINNSRLK